MADLLHEFRHWYRVSHTWRRGGRLHSTASALVIMADRRLGGARPYKRGPGHG